MSKPRCDFLDNYGQVCGKLASHEVHYIVANQRPREPGDDIHICPSCLSHMRSDPMMNLLQPAIATINPINKSFDSLT